jgi:hypothetical protein
VFVELLLCVPVTWITVKPSSEAGGVGEVMVG